MSDDKISKVRETQQNIKNSLNKITGKKAIDSIILAGVIESILDSIVDQYETIYDIKERFENIEKIFKDRDALEGI